MSLILFLIFGLAIGFIARALMPGRQPMSVVMTMIVGVVGSFVGGFLGALVTDSRVTDFNTSGIIGSILGALVTLFVVGRLSGGRR